LQACASESDTPRAPVIWSSGLVQLEAVGLNRILEQQCSVAAYRRLYRDINEVLDAACPTARRY
jgi:hypothetical protein